MMILVNTDNHIVGDAELTRQVESELTAALGRFGDQITRVEVHLNDINSHKGGENDKRCQLEARLSGLQPVSVTHQTSTVEEAVAGATEKLAKALDRTLGRLREHKGQTSFGGDQTI